jgi:hypothetical protein
MNPRRLITFAAIVLMGLLPSAVMALDEPGGDSATGWGTQPRTTLLLQG